MRKTIYTDKAPAALGPYSQANMVGNLLFLSGQVPIVPETGAVSGGGIAVQTERALKNVAEILKAAGTSMDKIKMRIYKIRYCRMW